MKADVKSYARIGLVAMMLAVVFTALSCGGGGGGTVDLASSGTKGAVVSNEISRSTGVLVTESEIATLPAWQQELLSDSGWNQPYITPRAKTEMPAPTWEMLESFVQSERDRGLNIQPRLSSGGKGASWMDQGDFDGAESVMLGEYDGLARAATPAYGCNSDGSNGSDDNAFEEVIREGTKYQPQAVSFVENGLSAPNWFNTAGGSGNDAQSAVYQLFASTRDVEAFNWENLPAVIFEELSYRADLAPGIGPGGDCGDAEAFLVAGLFWKRFNSTTTALPNLQEKYVYDILIAPADEESEALTSSGSTVGRYQEFYAGSLGACYGGGWIVGVESSASGCEDFDTKIVEAYDAGSPWYFSPIYGVLLQRWQDTGLTGMAGPWEGWLGWPVQGPMPYSNGAQNLTPKGTYYAWGMWFERGFMWWIDYDQNAYPATPDEAQVYVFTGSNVFCPGSGEYVEVAPTVYYGGEAVWPAPMGEPRVSVVVDSYRALPTDDWTPAELNEYNEYEIGLGNGGLATVNVAMHAHAFGGTPNEDCSYDYYVWAFRDGTIFMGDEAAAKYVTHTYGSDVRNMEAVYTVRVQVMDSTGALGYGDSQPINLGHGGGGGSVGEAEIIVIRNDGGAYPLNYQAILDDLDALGAQYAEVDYSGTIADDMATYPDAHMAIWYRGGPADSSETDPYEVVWTAEEIDNYLQILTDGYGLLLFSQSHGWNTTLYTGYGWGGWYGWDENVLDQTIPTGQERHFWATGATEASGCAATGLYGFLKSSPRNLPTFGSIGGKGPTDGYDNDGANAAERYNGSGSSGDVPVTYEFGQPTQMCGYGRCSPIQAGRWAPGFVDGVNCDPMFEGTWDMAFFSCGTTYAPYENIGFWPPPYNFSTFGDSSLWWVGYPWAATEVTDSADGDMVGAANRYMLLHNILGWIDDELTLGGGGSGAAGAYSAYDGHPEIIQLMAGNWETGGYNYQTVSYTWDGAAGHYPDQTMPNAYVTTDPGGNYVVTASENNDWINPNDVDFSFPWYAYIVDVDDDGVQIGEGNNVDDTVFFGGLLLEDPGTAWARDLTFYHFGQDPADRDNNVPSVVIDGFTPPVVVAGYYVSTTGDVGGEVRANYGTVPASVAFDNTNELTVECVAHWPVSMQYWGFDPGIGIVVPASEPLLYWSMYPGQNMLVPDIYRPSPQTIPPTTSVEDMTGGWDSYRWMFDVDPSVGIDFRDGTGAYTEADIWNRPQFEYTDASNSGRVVTFNYRSVNGWNPDLNRDGDDNSLGTGDVADKFPVRVRMFTDHEAYTLWGAGWPDHLQDAGIDPADGGPVWYDDENDPPAFLADWPDYIEGGAYVVDTGAPVYPLNIDDDPDAEDPYETVGGSTDNYSVTFNFLLEYGTADYDLEFNIGFDFGTGNDANAFGTAGMVYDGYTYSDNGIHTQIVSGIDAPGDLPEATDLYVAARVTDHSDPAQSDVYVWANPIQLVNTVSHVVVDDTSYSCPTQIQTDLQTAFGGTVPVLQSSTVTSASQLSGYSHVWWMTNTSTSTPGTLQRQALKDFIDNEGNVILWMPQHTTMYTLDNDYQMNYMGASAMSMGTRTSSSTSYMNHIESSYPLYNGPGGNGLSLLNFYTSSPYYYTGYFYGNYSSYSLAATAAQWGWTYVNYRAGIIYNDTNGNGNDNGGQHVWIGQYYYNCNPTIASGAPGPTAADHRVGLLLNIMNAMDPPPPTPCTVLHSNDFDGSITGGATWNVHTTSFGGTYSDTWTLINGPAAGFGPSNGAAGNCYAYHRYLPGHTTGYGNNNDKVMYMGPFNLSTLTADPIFFARVYSDQESSGTSWDRVWIGWDQDSSNPPTMVGRGASYSSAPPWNSATNIGDMGTAAAPAVCQVSLAGAGGQNNVWLAFCFSSDGSVETYPGTFIDAFTICANDGTDPPSGL